MRDLKTIASIFDKYDNEVYNFDKIENKLDSKREIHAILLLDNLFPDDNPFDSCDKDYLFLGLSINNIKKLTDENILELSRCGIYLDLEYKLLRIIII